MFKHQHLQNFNSWSQIRQIWVIFNHLKLWFAVASTTSSELKFKLFNLPLYGLRVLVQLQVGEKLNKITIAPALNKKWWLWKYIWHFCVVLLFAMECRLTRTRLSDIWNCLTLKYQLSFFCEMYFSVTALLSTSVQLRYHSVCLQFLIHTQFENKIESFSVNCLFFNCWEHEL